MQKVRFGVLGCASIAVRSMIPSLFRHPDVELVGIASRSPAKSEPMAREYACTPMKYDDLVGHPDIDAVYIPLPNALHTEWVNKCLAAGKHVLCEKSLGCTLREVEDMVALARAKRLLVMENFQFRFHSQHSQVKKILASGRLGDIRSFRSSFGFPPFADGSANIRYQKHLGGGALLDAGAYTIKATTFMLGEGFQVRAATLRYSPEYGVDLGGSVYLENTDGLVSQTGFGFDNYYQCNYEIWGSKGKLTAPRAFTAPPNFQPEIVIETQDGVHTEKLPADDHFEKLLTQVVAIVTSGNYEGEYRECCVQARLLAGAMEASGAG